MCHDALTDMDLTETLMTSPEPDYFTDIQVAAMLGKNPVTVRKWRGKNKNAGCIKYGPPYEYRGPNVVYPKVKFREWCGQVKMIDGVPYMNLPIDANVALPQQPTAMGQLELLDGE